MIILKRRYIVFFCCYNAFKLTKGFAVFEYKVVSVKDKLFGNRFSPEKLEKVINTLGNEGWELIQIANSDSAGMLTNRSEMIMIFKRSK